MRLAARFLAAMALAGMSSCQQAAVTPSPQCQVVRGQFTAATYDGSPVTPEALAETVAVIERRLERAGFVGGSVKSQDADVVVIELRVPAPADAFDVLIRRAIDVEFIPMASGAIVDTGDRVPGNTAAILNGADIASSMEATDQTGKPSVNITLTDAGRATLSDWTAAHIGDRLAITLHRVVLVAPSIRSPIDGGEVTIEGELTDAQVNELVTATDQGVLPLLLTQSGFDTVPAASCSRG